MQQLWTRIEAWMSANTDGDLALRPGATEAQIVALETTIGRRLPDDLRESFLIHDGQDMPSVRWLDGERRLHPLESIAEQWAFDAENSEDPDGPGEDPRAMGTLTHRDRLPLFGVSYWDGDNVYADFLPGPAGSPGQLLYRMDIELSVIAVSFRAFLEEYVRKLEAGELVYRQGVELYPEAKGRIEPASGGTGDVFAAFLPD